RLSLTGQTIIVVFNPAARDGRVNGDLPEMLRVLRGAGANVIPVETTADPEQRRLRIREATSRAMQGGRKFFVLPVGGDGTIGETVGEVLRGSGTSFDPSAATAPDSERSAGRSIFVLARKGTAADLAVQVDAPSRARDLPKFINNAVELGFRFPIIDGVEAGTHSMGFLASGYLFALRQQNRVANPNAFYNQGLFSFLRLLPHAIFNRYGMLGVDVTLTRKNLAGEILARETVTGVEVTVTPNRILAAVGGVPGAWGETKVVVLPSGPRGIVALTEYIGRGLFTKLGLNLVGPRSSLWTLGERRQWVVNPGEQIEVKTTVPDNLTWDLFRVYQDWRIRHGRAGPEARIPAAGDPLPVPAQRNGDVIGRISQFTVHAPTFTITKLAHPNSLAVRLARASWLVRGETPMISDQQMVANQPGDNPLIEHNEPGRRTIRTVFLSMPRLHRLMRQYQISPERAEGLLTASHGVETFSQLERLATERLTIEHLQAWLETPTGRNWAAQNNDSLQALRQRALRGGPPLAMGLVSLLGAERLADIAGLDPVQQRELRFAFVVYLAHAVNSSTHAVWQVAANHILRQPYHLASMRSVRVAGERLVQWTFLERPTMGGAMSQALLRQSGLEAGFTRGILARGYSLATLLPRAAWGMGHGLIFSRVVERMVHDAPEDSPLRTYAPTAAFFAPDLARLIAPARAGRFLEMRPMRFAARAFAAGFISDMAFTGLHRLHYGSDASYQLWTDVRTAEALRQNGEIGTFSWRQIPRLLSPSLSAYIDSHDFLFGSSSALREAIQAGDRAQSRSTEAMLRETFGWLPQVLGTTASDLLREEISLTEDERMMLEQLEHCAGGDRLRRDASFAETAAYLRQQFRGFVTSEEQANRHLGRIQAYRSQQAIAQLSQLEIEETTELRRLFDARGRLRPGTDSAFQTWLGTEATSSARSS
ncbi:MAG TPA: diacylglycerol kinase family protein, partial [bacterium]|nr:diacylglycerol kinase family protein [bacterium]